MNVMPALAAALLVTCAHARERFVTTSPHGHQIHHRQAFSPDSRYIYFDSRNDETQLAGSAFIGRVEIATGREEILYRVPDASSYGPGVGAVTCNPVTGRLAFIHGLDRASAASPYAAHRRSGASLSPDGKLIRLDARDITPPFTPGALSGGTHAHHWSGDGTRLSFTYNDALIPRRQAPADLRTVGIMTTGRPVTVENATLHEDFSGECFATLVVPVTASPRPGSDDISRAFDEGWLDLRRLAFQGTVRSGDGVDLTEVFLATLPPDPGPVTRQRELPPRPPAGISIRRLTETGSRKFPGIQGPRHWVRPSPDGSRIAFLARDDEGIVQVFAVTPEGGALIPLSHLTESVDGPFDWSPDSKSLVCPAGGRIQQIAIATGQAKVLTPQAPAGQEPRYSVTYSPDGRFIACNRLLPHSDGGSFLQISVIDAP
jgi:hypothetical protein